MANAPLKQFKFEFCNLFPFLSHKSQQHKTPYKILNFNPRIFLNQ